MIEVLSSNGVSHSPLHATHQDLLPGPPLQACVEAEVQRVVEVLSSSGAVSPWFMAHMYEVMRAAPRTSTTIDRPLPLFGGDQVMREGEWGKGGL